MPLTVRRLAPQDRESWERLYEDYAQFYKVTQTPEMRARVWSWIEGGIHGVEGFGAELDGRLVGIAHVRPFARPLSATVGGFLDDLFVDPEARGHRVADALLQHLKDQGLDAAGLYESAIDENVGINL